jgi:hypothetical protein
MIRVFENLELCDSNSVTVARNVDFDRLWPRSQIWGLKNKN